MKDAARLNHRRPVLCRPIRYFNGDFPWRFFARHAQRQAMNPSYAKTWLLRRHQRNCVNAEENLARLNSGSMGRAIFDDVEEHPSFAKRSIDCTQCGIDRIMRRYILPRFMEESGVAAAQCPKKVSNSFVEIVSICIDEHLGAFIDQRDPRGVVLLWIRNIDMFLRNQLPDCPDQFQSFVFGEWHCSVSMSWSSAGRNSWNRGSRYHRLLANALQRKARPIVGNR